MRAFRLAYDGAPFYGFQRQPDVPTVEGSVFDALARLGIHDQADDKPPGYSAAGRTDAGVSALAQTVTVECPDWCSPSALNAELPPAVRAWASADVPADFHATADAHRREYVYYLYTANADDERMQAAATRLSGRHDFHNLTTDDVRTVRELAIDLEREGGFAIVTVSADGFSRHLVRRLVSLVADVGSGGRSIDFVERVLDTEELSGHEGIQPAPAYPLVLSAVDYDVAFVPDHDAATAARELFEARRVEHAARSRVAGFVGDRL